MCQCRKRRRCEFDPWVRKITWRRKWSLTPVFLPWEIPCTEELGGLWSLESQRVGHDRATVHVKTLQVLQRLSKALANPVHTVWQQCNISSATVITHASSVGWSSPRPRWSYFVLWWKPFLLGTIPAKLRVVETVGKKAVSGLLGVTVRGSHSHFCLSYHQTRVFWWWGMLKPVFCLLMQSIPPHCYETQCCVFSQLAAPPSLQSPIPPVS